MQQQLHGEDRIEVRCGDAAQPSVWWDGTQFDAVLLDAPCSATGIMRTRPEVKAHQSEQSVARLRAGQLSMLRALMGCVTHCTGASALDVEGHYNPTENCSQYQPTPEQVHFVRTQNTVDARLYDAWCAESCARPTHPSLVGWRELPVL